MFLIGLLLGFSVGFGSAWAYFKVMHLIRTRDEYYAAVSRKETHGEYWRNCR